MVGEGRVAAGTVLVEAEKVPGVVEDLDAVEVFLRVVV